MSRGRQSFSYRFAVSPAMRWKHMRPDRKERQARKLLDQFVPDLLTEQRYEGFVNRLFASPKGEWLRVRHLCEGIDSAGPFFQPLSLLARTELMVVWLDHPDTGGEYAYIHFYLEDYLWTASHIYNIG